VTAKRTRWERPASSASRLKDVLIARDARSSVGPARKRTFAVSLQELWAHLQCADQDADGASAQEGEMARSRPGDDRGQEPGQDRATVRRSSDDGVPLATSVFARAGCQQAANAARDRRSGRDLRPRILQGPMVRSAARGAQTRRQGQASGALSGQYSRSRRPRPEGRDLRRGPASRSTGLP
jgi:hypothetical protein